MKIETIKRLLSETGVEIAEDVFEIPETKSLRLVGKHHIDTYSDNKRITISYLDDALYIDIGIREYGRVFHRRIMLTLDSIEYLEVYDIIRNPEPDNSVNSPYLMEDVGEGEVF